MRYTITNEPGPIPWGSEGRERVLSSAINAISSWQGETPYLPELGLDPDILHAPVSSAVPMAIDEAHRNLLAFVPGLKVIQVRAWMEAGSLRIEAVVEVE